MLLANLLTVFMWSANFTILFHSVFLELSKLFDTANHDILFQKIYFYFAIRGLLSLYYVRKWLAELYNIYHCVCADDAYLCISENNLNVLQLLVNFEL